jgi:hypothetical protein
LLGVEVGATGAGVATTSADPPEHAATTSAAITSDATRPLNITAHDRTGHRPQQCVT